MRKKEIFLSLGSLLVVLLAFSQLPFCEKQMEPLESTKPAVPQPSYVLTKKNGDLLSHPWIRMQPMIRTISAEMVRDMETLEEFCQTVAKQKEVECTLVQDLVISTWIELNKKVPFSFPQDLYNVLCIPESSKMFNPPAPFDVYQRLYLGETDFNFPFYLDVRVFDLTLCSTELLVDWHMQRLKKGQGAFQKMFQEGSHQIWVGRGEPASLAHGFASLDEERTLFLECLEQEGKLYIAYAEAPSKTYEKHKEVFLSRIYETTKKR